MKRWSAEEVNALKAMYSNTTNKELLRIFAGRSLTSIRRKAYALGLPKGEAAEFVNRSTGRVWSHKRQKNRRGYVLVYKPNHPRADSCGRVFEHIVVWEEANKTAIPDGFVIHHINGVKDDNRIENLRLLSNGEHTALHNAKRKISEETRRKMSDKAKSRYKKII